MSVHTLNPRMTCPSWCDHDVNWPETWPGSGDGVLEHCKQLAAVAFTSGTHPEVGQVIVSLTRSDYLSGGGERVAVEALGGGHNFGQWGSPQQLRQYAAALMSAADELEAAQTG